MLTKDTEEPGKLHTYVDVRDADMYQHLNCAWNTRNC